jgi:hypothetical protein
MLMREFGDDQAFTADSLNHVARACIAGFPPYPVLCVHLGEWWRGNRPLPPLLPACEAPPPPPREPPTDAERATVHALVQQFVSDVTYRERSYPTSRALPDEPQPARPRYLPPDVLDRINPLPNGRKRADAADR